MKERVRYFDIAKGVAIFCIIAGHMRNTIINNFVFTFHVPIFFLISGYFLKSNRPFKEFVTKKCNQLIRPYIITCICVIVGVSLSNIIRTHSLEHLVQDVKTWFIASLYGSGTIEYSSPFYMKQIGAIWFLLASFTAVVIVRYFIEYKHGWLGVVVLAYVGYKTGQMVWLPLSIQAGMTAAVFVYLGWLSNKYKLFEHPAPHMWISGAAIIWLFGILFCGKLYVVRNHFENGLFDIVVAVAGSYLVIVICQIIDKQTKYLANLLEFYGKNTLTILCMHEVEILTISWKWVWQIGEKLQLQTYQVIWIILILKMLLFTVGIYIIQFLKKVYTRIKGKIQKKYELCEKRKSTAVITSSMSESRIEYWDMAKGIAIMAMILGHIQIPGYLRIIIFSFHMPLFMIVNGYFIKNYNVKRTLMRSMRTLLVPYAIVCLLSAGIYTYIGSEGISTREMFLQKIKAMVGGMSKISTRFLTFDSVWVVWFVCCLFLARNIYVMLMKLSERYRIICPWGILSLAFLGYLMGKYYAFMPWSLDVALIALIFVGVGNWMKKVAFWEKSYCYTLVIPAVIWIYFLRMGISIELAIRSYPLGIFSIIEAIAGSMVIISIAKLLNKSKIITIILSWIGRNSMIILGIHCLELMYFNWEKYIFGYMPFTMNWFRVFIIKSICILSLTGVIVLVKKMKNFCITLPADRN